MTTPDTSAVRAWARNNGFDVGDRGRIPGEVQEAYRAAHGGSGSQRKASATKPRAATPAAKRTAKPTAKASSSAASTGREASTGDRTPRPKPSPVADDRRLVALGEELAALTKRVEALEAAVGTKSNGKSGGKPGDKKPRFRRAR